MRTYLDCYPCFLRQSIEAARKAGASQDQQKSIVRQTLEILKNISDRATPPEIGTRVHETVRSMTGHEDPYQQVKQRARSEAFSMLPRLRELVEEAEDPLDTALRISIAGNIMDFGPNPDYELWEVVERILHQEIAIDDSDLLRGKLAGVDRVLFLGDNVGESVFDMLLIETLRRPVTYVVRGGPVLNDTTREDAIAIGMTDVAEVIDNGSRVPGTILSICTPEFQTRFSEANLILAKGMGNFETLSEIDAPLFFLLQVKCPTISDIIGVPVGSIVIKSGLGIEQ